MLVAFIGDIHGDFGCLNRHVSYLSDKYPELDLIIQVGDFGFYPKAEEEIGDFVKHPKAKMRFIRGNHEDHDSLPLDARAPIKVGYGDWEFVPDGYMEDGLLYLGGAFSIDKEYRLSVQKNCAAYGKEYHYRWFPNEEISQDKQNELLGYLDLSGVRCIVSHDCPQSICKKIHHYGAFPTSTGMFLERILQRFSYLNLEEPEWIFGHHHLQYINKKFTGLNFEGKVGFMTIREFI